MIYIEKKRIPSKEILIEHILSNCIKCGSDDININEYDDKYGFITTITCKNKKCKHEIIVNADSKTCIKEWNLQNNIPIVIENKKLQILKIKQEIKDLIKLNKQRSKIKIC